VQHNLIGAVGLLLVAILGPIGLIAVWTELVAGLVLFGWTLLAFVLWTFVLARAAGLRYRLAVGWMAFWVASLVVGSVVIALPAVLGSAVGIEPNSGRRTFAGWARRDPERAATMQALRRAAMARATDEDARRLALGPRRFFRG
jgi:hypothetical protein